jgi:small subunit ribosomal protein S4e
MHTKRIAVGYGKKPRWITTARAGSHEKGESIPLMLVVRDILGYADTAKAARKIINDGMVLVDKKPRKDYAYGVGLMDIIEIPETKRYFRVLPGTKKPLLKEIDEKEATFKLCRIVGKKKVKDGKIQINLHDGSTMLLDKNDYKLGDTLVVEIPSRTVKEVIELKKGSTALVSKGRHRGESGKVSEVLESTVGRESLTTVNDFQTLTDYIFVVGKDKPIITLEE